MVTLADLVDLPIARVRWLDAQSRSGWQKIDEVRREAKEFDTYTQNSVGFIASDDRSGICLLQTVGQEDMCAEALWIPRKYIKSIHTLESIN